MKEIVYAKHVEKACSFCGQMFTPKRSNAKYCSDRCKHNAGKVRQGLEPCIVRTKICKCCGQEFETDYKKRENCYSCRPYKADYHAHKPTKQFKCVICGKEFESSDHRRKTCGSKECKKINHNGHGDPNYKPREKKEKPQKQKETVSCVICGADFERTVGMNNKCCSHQCSVIHKKNKRKAKGSSKSQNRRAKKLGLLVDRDITLEKLRRRDQDICWICGQKVDDTDYEIINGYRICGRMYPSIDHLLPLARGGKHEWGNVGLAHHGCNSLKSASNSANINEETYYELLKFANERGQTHSKVVIQYAGGVELCRYMSAGDASIKTGLKKESISNACRGKGATGSHKYKNFEWIYAEE